MDDLLSPIAPAFRFRVGVSGHRVPPKLPKESEAPILATLRGILDTVVSTIKNVEADYRRFLGEGVQTAPQLVELIEGPDKFVVVSSVAEGADRLLADAGESCGFALEVVLPLGRTEYAKDFETAESKSHYERLLGRAAAVFELDGGSDDRPRAYEAAGLVMLANCDLLIAIWDGEEAAGIGGTAHIVSRAIANGIPVVWVKPADPDAMKISWPAPGQIPPSNALPAENFRDGRQEDLKDAIAQIVAPPRQPEARKALYRYLSEKERRWNYHIVYSLLLVVYRIRPIRIGDFHLPTALAGAAADWQSFLAALPADKTQRPVIDRILLPAFAAADHIAVYFSYAYRSSYVFNFLFTALAVAIALGGVFTHDPDVKGRLVVIELVIIFSILFAWRHGHRGDWHRRWLDYRRLAECLRHLRIFAPLAAEGSIDRPRHNLADDEEDWVNWYAWSVRRLLPLPNCAVDEAYLKQIRAAVRNGELKGQIQYHRANCKRMSKLDHRVHLTGLVLFALTFAIALVFAPLAMAGAIRKMLPHEEIRNWVLSALTFVTALLPTLGAAVGGIHAQGDFKSVAEQSARTLQRLRGIAKTIRFDPPTFARLTDRVEKASETMMSELLEWQTVFRTRPLSPPA